MMQTIATTNVLPLLILPVLRRGSVVASSQPSAVVRHSIQVIQQRRILHLSTLDVVSQIQSSDGEINVFIDFLTMHKVLTYGTSSEHTSAVQNNVLTRDILKSLQM